MTYLQDTILADFCGLITSVVKKRKTEAGMSPKFLPSLVAKGAEAPGAERKRQRYGVGSISLVSARPSLEVSA